MLATLLAIRAPRDLVGWVEQAGPEDAFDGCDRPDWWVWMAAARREPVGALLDHAIDVVLELGEGLGTDVPAIERAIEVLRTKDPQADLVEHAVACEHLDTDAPHAYRTAISPTVSRYAVALAWLLRAEDGLRSALASAQIQTDLEAMFRATGVGVSPALMGRTIRDLVLDPSGTDTPVGQSLTFVLDAAGQGLLAAARTRSEEPRDVDDAELQLTDALFDRLER